VVPPLRRYVDDRLAAGFRARQRRRARGPEALDGHLDMPEATSQSLASAVISLACAVGVFYLARIILPNVRN
jgi:hypothetical protein